MRPRDPRLLLLVSAALLGAAVAFPLGVVASHQFSDVPDSNMFHTDIDAIADAGVTSGCGGGKYCPAEFVTREQMAAFMNRLGALGPGKIPVVNAAEVDGFDSAQFVRSDVIHTDYFHCVGADMSTPTSTTVFGTGVSVSKYATVGAAQFGCTVTVPDGATIVDVSWVVYDNTASDYVYCALNRVHFSGSNIIVETRALSLTGLLDMSSNWLTISDGTFAPELIDNSQYVYLSTCGVGSTSNTRVGDTIVQYEFTY